MNYPLISEYIEAIKAAEDNFEQLNYLRPVQDEAGEPVMSSGNFAVVFMMKDKQTGRLYAVKCFLKEQEGRAEAYRMIAEELEYVNSTFLTPIKYLDKELFVDTKNSDETEFPVLLMDWVEGQTLDKYIQNHLFDQYDLSLLAYQFSRLAMWLMPQPFAHGDLKPDNILVKEDGTLVLVDYDGMFVPAMKGQKARELGSPDFRHPSRTEDDFDEHIDDFSLASILLSLKAISLQPSLLEEYGASDRLLFSENDYRNFSKCEVLKELYPSSDSELNILISLFTITIEKTKLSDISFRLLNLNRPKEKEITNKELEAWYKALEEEMAPYDMEESWTFDSFIKEFKIISFQEGSPYYSVTGGGEDGFYFKTKNGKEIIVFNQSGLTKDSLIQHKDNIIVELRKTGHYILCLSIDNSNITNNKDIWDNTITDEYLNTEVTDNDLENAWTDEYGAKYSADKRRLLRGPNDMESYHILDGTLIICDNAFHNCRSIKEIIMPSTLKVIGNKALWQCTTLESINIPHSVLKIGDNAFAGCLSLTKIFLPKSINTIGSLVFGKRIDTHSSILERAVGRACKWCENLSSIIVPWGYKKYYEDLLPNYKDKIVEQDKGSNYLHQKRCHGIIKDYLRNA